MKSVTDDIIEGIVMSETNKIASGEKTSEETSTALTSVLNDYIESAVFKYTRELASMVINEEQTLDEDSLMLTQMLIDS